MQLEPGSYRRTSPPNLYRPVPAWLYIAHNWGEPERAPHRAVSMSSLRESRVWTVNDKIRWTSHSSHFVIVARVACVDCER